MIRLPQTLAFRLTFWYASILVASTLLAFLVLFLSINSVLNSRIEEDLQEDVLELKNFFTIGGLERLKEEIDREVSPDEADQDFVRLLDIQGKQIHASDLSQWRGLAVDEQALLDLAAGAELVAGTASLPDHDSDARYIYGLIGPAIIIQVGESLEEKDELLELLSATLGVLVIAVVALSAPVGWFMARRALQGVEEVSRAAEDIANGAFNRRVSVRDRSEEIERLVATFNVMVDRIAAVISQMRTMTDNIAHDLRSPLGRIRAIAERALSASRSVDEHRTASADTLEECDRLLQMINTTLDVAEAEVGAAQLLKEEIDLASIIQDACELFEPIAEDKEIEISAKLEANCQVRGNIQYVQRMLANLLDNALKYTPPKGSVSVELARDDQVAAISVSDTGVGIAPDEQARIFERFYRGDQSRSQQGFGLGLSFARAVAHALGGDISVTSTPNKGSRFTVTLPAAAPAI